MPARVLLLAGLLLAAAPASAAYKGCADDGDGGDAALNRQKNRIGWPAGNAFELVDLASSSIKQPGLGGPCAPVPNPLPRDRARWPAGFLNCVTAEEAKGICLVGTIFKVKAQSVESVNCGKTKKGQADFKDYHIWLGAPGVAHARNTWIVEITPRVRDLYGWTDAEIKGMAGKKVAVMGLKLFDQWHRTVTHRKSAWEIHPVMYIWVETTPGTWVYLGGKTVGAWAGGRPPPTCS